MVEIIIPGRVYSAEQVFELAERSIWDHAQSFGKHANMPMLNAGCLLLAAAAIQIARSTSPALAKTFLHELGELIEADKNLIKVDVARTKLNAAMNRIVAAGRF